MEKLQHFSHEHLLSLVHLQPKLKQENSDEEDEDEDEDEDKYDLLVEEQHGGSCNMCEEQIYSFHLCYYKCDDCDYSLHKFCAQLPTTLQNHSLHPGHSLTLSKGLKVTGDGFEYSYGYGYIWRCDVCKIKQKKFFLYHCSICKFSMDILCATMCDHKMDHPCHPHRLERMFCPMISMCGACGNKHQGTFYYCTMCQFCIHLDCALLPAKLLIQRPTNETFTHSHPLTLAYSFPFLDEKENFFPRCRVCDKWFNHYLWLYKCDKCRYYAHIDCATSKGEPFMSIFLSASLGKTSKNYKDEDHPNLLHYPFPDESYNLVKHHMHSFNQDFIGKQNNRKMLNHFSHQHPLILFDMQTSVPDNKLVSLHNPMKKTQLLCDGCVKPVMTVPFYKCSLDVEECDFVLHKWCALLPYELANYQGHPEHMLTLMPKIPSPLHINVFGCRICKLLSNGFVYGCRRCGYYIDINCAFIPEEITHEAHPNHILTKMKFSTVKSYVYCKACKYSMGNEFGFHCPSCDFFLHISCALLLPRVIRHKYDKHPLSLRYYPAENHISEYFCENCEEKLNHRYWFYHCTTCAQSIHTACAPIILQSEQARGSKTYGCVYPFLNVKFGRILKIKGHQHPLTFLQGIESDGRCIKCQKDLHYQIIFKCLECKFALHSWCVFSYDN